jgi:hypothetical protein
MQARMDRWKEDVASLKGTSKYLKSLVIEKKVESGTDGSQAVSHAKIAPELDEWVHVD